MVANADKVALRVSALGKVQVAREWGSDAEVVVELDLGQLETVLQWLYKTMAVSAAPHRHDLGPSPWFGADPRLLGGDAAKGARPHLGVPVEVLALLSRLPRDRAVSETFRSAAGNGGSVPEDGDTPCVVDGFAGIRWGTSVSAIPDLAQTRPVGETREGIPFYMTYAKLVNESGFAAYYADPMSEDLIGGAYVFSPTGDTWEAAWYDLVDSITSGFPELSIRERFRFHPKDPRRSVSYVDANNDEVVTLTLGSDAGLPLLHILYRSRRLIARQAQAIEEDRRKLGPVGDAGSEVPLRLLRSKGAGPA